MSACRKHQNRGVVALLPQPGAERKPVEKRQIEVEHNGVVGRAACRSACQLQAVRAGPGIIAVHVFQCEIFHNGCGQVHIIFHKQDVQHAAPLPYPEAQGNEDFCSLPPKTNSARNEPYTRHGCVSHRLILTQAEGKKTINQRFLVVWAHNDRPWPCIFHSPR